MGSLPGKQPQAGTRRRVCDNVAIPLNWKSFLRLNDYKKELFQYLAASVQSLGISDVEVTSTADVDVISSSTIDEAGLAPCNHEEADTRIFVHARHASLNGMKKILIRTVDADVVILAIAFAKKLEVEGEGLPFFHALTGCDTVSFFSGKGKKTAFQAWKCYPEATEVFRALSLPQTILS